VADRRQFDPLDTEGTIQRVRLELHRDNLDGALEMLGEAYAVFPCTRYSAETARVREWLAHLRSREAYVAAFERHYRSTRTGLRPRMLDRAVRTLTGRRTRKMIERCAAGAEYRLLEREALVLKASRVLDAGCGEGRVALTLADAHPAMNVDGLDASATNVRMARRLNRFPNVEFHEGLIEEAGDHFPYDAFDLVYAFGVLEHVRDVDETVTAALKLTRSGGRFCLSVAMHELEAVGPLPEVASETTVRRVRVFTEAGLRERFGGYPGFTLTKLPGEWRQGRYPESIAPVEFGSYFVAFSRP
jgi:2-polyprenyl-3-methyl-5-hydroxy-6-metoxy-1,4-benzoquinol methylase